MFIGYEQLAVSSVVKSVADLTVPPKATHCQLQADTAGIRYRMDGGDPTTSVGMVLLVTEPPATFLIEDLLRIKVIRSGGSDAKLNVHYFAGRDI